MSANSFDAPIASRTRARMPVLAPPTTTMRARNNQRGRNRGQTITARGGQTSIRNRRSNGQFASSPISTATNSEGNRMRTRSMTRQLVLEIAHSSELRRRTRNLTSTGTRNRRGGARRALFTTNPPMLPQQPQGWGRSSQTHRSTNIGINDAIFQTAASVSSNSNLSQSISSVSTLMSSGAESTQASFNGYNQNNIPVVRGFFDMFNFNFDSALNRNRLNVQDLIAGSFDSRTESRNPLMCNICLQPYQDRQPIVVICGHIFCRECIARHLESPNALCVVCGHSIHGTFLKRLFP